MPGSIFRQEVKQATGSTWEEWVVRLQQSVDPQWSHEGIASHISEQYEASEEWSEWLAVMYGQVLGRTPVGVTKDAGVQIGVRKTVAAPKERVWDYLVSQEGLKLWIGDAPSFKLEQGEVYQSEEGIFGKLTVVKPYHKLRLTWQRPEWDNPSRLQIYVLSAKGDKTTISIHQEMLDDVYMRELMKRFWEERLDEWIRGL
ncbi:SRPBCC domain-containing protein [Paenibacillus sp. 1011MAR3C5]|uniref:SRPBCC family protein n=1 Tax=Paenibacillus sp. 1011MAR3C5 TaxID=1675787 RepID=UPI000E6BE026|nr:SRPBCC domain-containing protein [Paenibacillus sp. 1011MAR3C5]RJE89626.1 SRPBCC domain-containing protein [Paenibacillus sp. 1011MAR3C5]